MKKFLKWGGIALVVIIIFSAIGRSNNSNSGSKSSNNSQQQVEPTPTPQEIEVTTLGDAFDANQVAAEKEWKGKFVKFSAEINNITDSGLSFHNVATKEFSLTQISCRIKDKEQLLSLTNGQTVTVQGVVGGQSIGVIDVSNCKVVE